MSIFTEIGALRAMGALEHNEEILACVLGVVVGMEDADRDGIMFITDSKLGVSASGMIFTTDNYSWVSFHQVQRTLVSSNNAFVVSTSSGNFHVKNVVDADPSASDFGEMLRSLTNRHLNADLFDLFNRANDLLNNDDTESDPGEAKRIAQEILRKQPESVDGLSLLATAAEELGLYDEAITATANELAAAVPLSAPEAFEFDRRFAVLHAQTENIGGVISYANRMVKADSNAAVGYYLRGLARRELEEAEAARSDFLNAVRCDPEASSAWEYLGELAVGARNLVELERVIWKLDGLNDSLVARGLEIRLAALKDNDELVYRLGCEYFDQGGQDLDVVDEYLEAASALDDVDVLPIIEDFDQRFQEQPYYTLISSVVLLQEGLAQQALRRMNSSRSIIAENVPKLVAWMDAIAALCEATILSDQGSTGQLVGIVRSHVEEDDWIQGEYERRVWIGLAIYLAKGLLHQGDYVEAQNILHRVEGAAKSVPAALIEQVPFLIEETDRGFNEQALGGTLSTTELGTYDLLSRSVSLLEESKYLQELARESRRMLVEFDQPPLVAVMGEYSVGKSTFINALLGSELLPTGEGVTTGTITWLRYGDREFMRVLFRDGRAIEYPTLRAIEDVVRETEEGGTASNIRHVEVFLNAEILRQINIVDTPGLNAPFPEHKKTTEEFLEKADAVLFLFNAEVAGKATERDFLAKLDEHRRKALGIINQIDLIPRDEISDVIEDIQLDFGEAFAQVLPVSGHLALRGKIEQDDKKLVRSRLPELETWLHGNLLDPAREVKQAAQRQKVHELLLSVGTQREEFDEGVADSRGLLSDAVNLFGVWSRGALSEQIELATTKLRKSVVLAVDDLVKRIADESIGKDLASRPFIATQSSQMRRECQKSWEEFSIQLARTFDQFIGGILELLMDITSLEPGGAFDKELIRLGVHIDSWKKDLLDYVEGVDSYSQAFFEAEGVFMTCVFEIPNERHLNFAEIQQVLQPKLEFLVALAEAAAWRWRRELDSNFDTAFAKLEKLYRTEAASTRQTSFRNVERLAAFV